MLSALKKIKKQNKEPLLTRQQYIQKAAAIFKGYILSEDEQKPLLEGIHATAICLHCFTTSFDPIDIVIRKGNTITLYKCHKCQNEFWKETSNHRSQA